MGWRDGRRAEQGSTKGRVVSGLRRRPVIALLFMMLLLSCILRGGHGRCLARGSGRRERRRTTRFTSRVAQDGGRRRCRYFLRRGERASKPLCRVSRAHPAPSVPQTYFPATLDIYQRDCTVVREVRVETFAVGRALRWALTAAPAPAPAPAPVPVPLLFCSDPTNGRPARQWPVLAAAGLRPAAKHESTSHFFDTFCSCSRCLCCSHGRSVGRAVANVHGISRWPRVDEIL